MSLRFQSLVLTLLMSLCASAQSQFHIRHRAFNNGTENDKRYVHPGYPTGIQCPHSGEVHVPILLVDFPDLPLQFNSEQFETYFNSMAPATDVDYNDQYGFHGSVARYFYDSSLGNLQFHFDIFGTYTAANPRDYYADKNGRNRALTLATEVLTQADADIDFSQFDSNEDGYLDLLYIVYAGTGANFGGVGDPAHDIWPMCWHGTSYVFDGVRIPIVGLSNEIGITKVAMPSLSADLPSGIGTLCHEISHGLGLPDLYCTYAAAEIDEHGLPDWNNYGPEFWDVMDAGENIGNTYWPILYSAWECDIFGWTELEELNEPQQLTIYPLSDPERGKAYRITNPANPNEYYILEVPCSKGWNSYANASFNTDGGLLITHVNFSTTQFYSTPNNTYQHPNLTIVPADGFILGYSSILESAIWYKGKQQAVTYSTYLDDLRTDLYPGPLGVTSLAAYHNYAGDKDMVEQFPITDIRKNPDGSVSLSFMGGTTPLTAISNTNSPTPSSFTLLGTRCQSAFPGITIVGGKKVLNR